VLVELTPFALLAAGFSLLSIVALHPPAQLGPGAKLAVSAYSLELYLTKTVLPIGLSPLYEMPTRIDPLAPRFLVAYVTCMVLAFAGWRLWRRWPGATTALVAFALISLPMLGVVQNGPQIAADRYTYHASPALAMLVAGLLLAAPVVAGAQRTIAAVVVAVLGLLTWKQTSVWHDSEQLWARVLNEDPSSVMGQSAMANVRYKQGRIGEGLELSRRAIELSPTFAQAHNDVGVGLASRGQLAEAASEYRTAIALDSTNSDEPLNNLGVILVRQGDIDGGIQKYRRALEINADYADAHVNWGNALVRERQFTEAIPHYEAALAIRPADADAHHNWGVALAQQGRFAEAADQFRAALAIDPDHAEAKDYLARATRLIAPR
jgi:Tfp pilus assembly protein PilF